MRFSPEGLQFEQPAALVLNYRNCLLVLVQKRIVYTDEKLKILEVLRSLDLSEADRRRPDRPLLPVRGRVLSRDTRSKHSPPGAVGPGERAPPRRGFFT